MTKHCYYFNIILIFVFIFLLNSCIISIPYNAPDIQQNPNATRSIYIKGIVLNIMEDYGPKMSIESKKAGFRTFWPYTNIDGPTYVKTIIEQTAAELGFNVLTNESQIKDKTYVFDLEVRKVVTWDEAYYGFFRIHSDIAAMLKNIKNGNEEDLNEFYHVLALYSTHSVMYDILKKATERFKEKVKAYLKTLQ